MLLAIFRKRAAAGAEEALAHTALHDDSVSNRSTKSLEHQKKRPAVSHCLNFLPWARISFLNSLDQKFTRQIMIPEDQESSVS